MLLLSTSSFQQCVNVQQDNMMVLLNKNILNINPTIVTIHMQTILCTQCNSKKEEDMHATTIHTCNNNTSTDDGDTPGGATWWCLLDVQASSIYLLSL